MQEEETGEHTIIVIDPEGDCLLRVSDSAYPAFTAVYRVITSKLKASSQYFTKLLEPRFAEGTEFEARTRKLLHKYGQHKDVPEIELPVITVDSIGRIGTIKDFRGLVTDLLRVIHGLTLVKGHLTVPIANLTNLAILADRFDASESLKAYAYRQNIFAGTQRRKSVAPDAWNEERTRMRLLVAVLLDHEPWFAESLALIVKGSSRWRNDVENDHNQALWWDLPRGLEEELLFRRQAVIKSISMLLTRCLSLYVSGILQCKLGYANSIQCDVFQLGQSIRFYNKLGLLHLEATMAGMDGKDPFDGDVQKALDLLKQCPSYQIDKFHTHCGMRDKLTRIVDMLQSTLSEIAVCGQCWTQRNFTYAWRNTKAPALATLKMAEKKSGCHNAHARTRDFYLANDKTWAD